MYKVPGWNTLPLSQVTSDWIFGKTPSRSDHANYTEEGGLPWAKAEDIHGGTLTRTGERVTAAAAAHMAVIQPGDVLVSTAGSIGKTAIAGVPMVCNQAVQAIRFNEQIVLPAFGYYYLMHQAPQLRRLAIRLAAPNLTQSALKEFPICFPSLQLQRRLVRVLENAEAAVRKREAQLPLLERYLSALFAQLFAAEEPAYVSLPQLLAQPAQKGLVQRRADSPTGFVAVSSFGESRFLLSDLSGLPPVELSADRAEKYRIVPGDLLIRALPGTVPTIRLAGKTDGDTPVAGAGLFRLRAAADRVLPEYLYAALFSFFRSPRRRALSFPLEQALEACSVPVVSLERQRAFRAQFRTFMQLSDRMETAAQQTRRLFDILLQRAMLGLLFPADGAQTLPADLLLHLQTPPRRTNQPSLPRLPAAMQTILARLSPAQEKLFSSLLAAGRPLTVDELTTKQCSRPAAQATLRLLTQLGLLDMTPQPIHDPSSGKPDDDNWFLDHNGQAITVPLYRLSDDLGEPPCD